MRRVERAELMDYVTWTEQRPALRPDFLRAKEQRRIGLGSCLTFLFENHETVRYQVLEMMRVERIVREQDIRHELDTYNELLGQAGGLGCTLLIGIDDEGERDACLRRWIDLLPTLHAVMADGRKVPAQWDQRQVGTDRLSAVQYLQFPVGGEVPIGLSCSHEDERLHGEVELTAQQREALGSDLQGL